MANKFKAFFALHKKMQAQGDTRERHEVIQDFTKGKKSSLKELTHWELKELTLSMSRMVSATFPTGEQSEYHKCNVMRRKLIAILTKVGFVENAKADMKRINNWCKSHGYLHKDLNDYKYNELPKLISQAEIMYWKFLNELS